MSQTTSERMPGSSPFTAEWVACDEANKRAQQEYNLAMQRRRGVVPSTEAIDNAAVPTPTVLSEAEASANYHAAREHTTPVARWAEDAEREFAEAEAKVDSYSEVEREIKLSRQADIEAGRKPVTPLAKQAALAALQEAQSELGLAREAHSYFRTELAKAEAEEKRCYAVARIAAGIGLANDVIKPKVDRWHALLNELDTLRTELSAVPTGIGDDVVAHLIADAMRREMALPAEYSLADARIAWSAQLTARLNECLHATAVLLAD